MCVIEIDFLLCQADYAKKGNAERIVGVIYLSFLLRRPPISCVCVCVYVAHIFGYSWGVEMRTIPARHA